MSETIENYLVSEINERCVLRSFELSPEIAIEIGEKIGSVGEETFYKKEHRELYKLYNKILLDGERINKETIIPIISANLPLLSAYKAISKINVKKSQISKYLETIKDKLLYRRIDEIRNSIENRLRNNNEDPIEILNSIHGNIIDISSQDNNNDDEPLSSILPQIIPDPNNIQPIRSGMLGITTGIKPIDRLTKGLQKGHLILLAARPSQGKALTMDSKLLTPDGFVEMATAYEGMKIAGSDGKFYKVTGVYPQGIKDTYKMKFSDGSTVECTEDHLWKVNSRGGRQKNSRCKPYSTRKTEYIIEHLKRENGKRNNFSIDYCKPIEFKEYNNKLPIDPYLLGVYIGDGNCNRNTVRITNTDSDIINRIKRVLHHEDKLVKDNHKEYRIKRWVKNNKPSNTSQELKNLGLLGKKSEDKFIPKQYLLSSVYKRINILNGICDADGCLNGKNHFSITTKSEQLSKDLLFLIRSLGGRASITKKYNKKYDRYYHVVNGSFFNHVEYYNQINPFYCPRKRLKYEGNPRSKRKFITDIIYVGKKPCQCISVNSPDNLFITDGFNLTHNTELALQMSINCAKKDKKPVLFFSLETDKKTLVKRVISHMTKIDLQKIRILDLNEQEKQILKGVYNDIKILPLYISEDSIMNVAKINSRIRRMQYLLREEIGLVVVDFIQLMKGSNYGNRNQELDSISKELKILSKQLKIPIVALSQLSRTIESRHEENDYTQPPMLSDLRDSGGLEQNADEVFFITSESHRDPETGDFVSERKARIWLLKQKEGPTGFVKAINKCSIGTFIDEKEQTQNNDEWI